MEVDPINIDDGTFLPAKNTVKLRQKNDKSPKPENSMEVDQASKSVTTLKTKSKKGRKPILITKKKRQVDDEASKDMRKISVPAHRYVFFILYQSKSNK